MKHNINEFKTQLADIEEWLKKELSGIRTGRATVTLLDSIHVEAYGTKTPLNQSANINIEDPKTIRIAPWDKSLIGEIEKAITKADLGVSTSVDGEGVRVIFPDLTTETREKLVKQAKAKIEEAKVSIRNARNKIMKDIDEDKKEAGLPEDDANRAKENVDSIIKTTQSNFDELLKKKETEIMN